MCLSVDTSLSLLRNVRFSVSCFLVKFIKYVNTWTVWSSTGSDLWLQVRTARPITWSIRTEFQKYSVISTRLTFFKEMPSAPDWVIIITLAIFPYICSLSILRCFNCSCITLGSALLLPLNIFIRILVLTLSELKTTYLLLSYISSNTSMSSTIYPNSSLFTIFISAYPCLLRTSLNIPRPSIIRNCEYTKTLPGDELMSSYICANFGLYTSRSLSISK